jgi:hypothetical protein
MNVAGSPAEEIVDPDPSDDLVARYILRSNNSSPPGVEISEFYYVPTKEDLEPDMVSFDPSRADFRYSHH